MAAGGGPVRIPFDELPKLPLDQLRQVKEQLDSELSVLNDSLTNIRTAATRFEAASRTLDELSHQSEGKKVLVPLTSSLYVPGTLCQVERVLVDVGTTYYIEKTLPNGVDYCQRKIAFLKGNHERVTEVASQKATQVDQVAMVMQGKMRASMASSVPES